MQLSSRSKPRPLSSGGRPKRSRQQRILASLALGGAALAGAALYNRRKARLAERRNPPPGRFIEVEGVRLHYVMHGDGQPVVFLHGNGTMVQDWQISGVLDAIAQDHRVIAFDRPGFGYSQRPRNRIWTPSAQAELIREALQRLGVERPVVVGHSWGTLVALALALDHPQDVSAVVLLSGYYYPSARADVPLMSGPAVPVLGDILRYTLSPLIGRLVRGAVIRRIFAPSPVPARFAAFPTELALRPSQIRASAADTALMVPAAAGLAGRYGELRMPVVIAAGEADKIVKFAQTARLHQDVARSDLRRIVGAGHMIQHIAPAHVVAAIRDAAKSADSSWSSGRHSGPPAARPAMDDKTKPKVEPPR